MKTTKLATLFTGLMLAAFTPAHGQESESAPPAAPAEAAASGTEAPQVESAPAPAPVRTQREGRRGGQPAAPASSAAVSASSPDEIRLNFRNVPLDMVLEHLSEAAGFIVVREAEVRGRVDVFSAQPLTRAEAVDLLDTVLSRNGYAAIRNGRTLRIVNRFDASRENLPVRQGSDPAAIPSSAEMVTQIIPVRYADAVQMTRDLMPLLPEYATLTANQAANTLVLTDTQANIRRMAEIVRALDTSISTISTIRVFLLRHADATAMATAVRELFQPAAAGRGNQGGGRQNQVATQFGRGGNQAQGGGRGGGGGGSEARTAAARVLAVPDERTNALVISAPEELIPTIERLVEEIDVNVDDLVEVRVFRLFYSNPTETTSLLMSLFPDNAVGQQGNRGGQARGRGATATGTSRLNRQTRIIVVPELRTQSIVVSASAEIMDQIARMIEEIDSNPAGDQKVVVYSLENADPAQVEAILQGLLDTQTGARQGARAGTARGNAQTQRGGAQTGNRGGAVNRGGATNRGGAGNRGGGGGFGAGGGFGF